MPILTLPAVEQTGLRQLGAGLLAGTSALAERGRRREDENRRREQLLGDVENERGYQETIRQIQRNEKLTDEQKRRALAQAFADATYRDEQALTEKLTAIEGRRAGLIDRAGAEYAGPSRREVRELAEQRAGPKAKPEQIDAAMEKAGQDLFNQGLIKHQMAQQAAIEEARILQQEATNLVQQMTNKRATLNTVVSQFGAVPTLAEPSASSPIITPRTPAPSLGSSGGAQGSGGLEGALNATFGVSGTPQPGAPSGPGAVPAPARRPSLAGAVEGMASLPGPRSVVGALPQLIPEMARQGEGLLTGVLSGDYSIPERGLIERAGTALGGLFATDPMVFNAEERILKEQPYSPKALEIRRRRAQQSTQQARQLSLPDSSPSTYTPPAARVPMLLDPSTSFMP